MKAQERYFWPLLVLLIIPAFAWGIFCSEPRLNATNLIFNDGIDQQLIVAGLERTHTFADTLKWWTGPWIDGWECAFYRPITSYIWWFQWEIFGASRESQNAMVSFMAVHWLSHFAVCLLAGGFLRRLFGARIAILTVVIWAGCFLNALKLPVPMWALPAWKDSPDFWVAGAIICSLWALLSNIRTGEKRFLLWVFTAQIIGIGFKESVYVLPFMAAVLLWYESALHKWRIVAAMVGLTVAAYVFRFWALQGPGFRFGTNGSWFERFLLYVGGGKPVYLWSQGDLAPLAVGVLIVGIGMIIRGKRETGFGVVVFSGIGILVADAVRGEIGLTAIRLLQPFLATYWKTGLEMIQTSTIAAITIMSLSWTLKRPDRRMLCAFGWVFAAYLPMLTAPITEHALYLASMGSALWWCILLVELLDKALVKVRESKFYPPRLAAKLS